MLVDFTVLDNSNNIQTVYTSYKQPAPFVSPRDFVVRTSQAMLSREEQENLQLNPTHERLFITASTHGDNALHPPTRDKVRGCVNAFGYAAYENADNSITVVNFMCVDPAGSIPAFAVAAGVSDQAAKLNALLERSSKLKIEKPVVAAPVASEPATPEPVAREAEQPSAPAAKAVNENGTYLVDEQLAVIKPIVRLLKEKHYSAPRVQKDCQVSDIDVSYLPQKVYRIERRYKCSLDAFQVIASDEKVSKEVDSMLVDFTVLDNSNNIQTVYTSYKQPAPFVSPRDFVVRTSQAMLSREEQENLQLNPTHERLFITASTHGDNALHPPTRDKVRGCVNAFGYAAYENADNSITVVNFMCVDPAGSIPAFAVAAGVTDQAAKLNALLERSSKLKIEKPVVAAPVASEPATPEPQAVQTEKAEAAVDDGDASSSLSQSLVSVNSVSDDDADHNSRLVSVAELNNFCVTSRTGKWTPFGKLSSEEYEVETLTEFPENCAFPKNRKNSYVVRIQTHFDCSLSILEDTMKNGTHHYHPNLTCVKKDGGDLKRLYVFDGAYPFDVALSVYSGTLRGEEGTTFGLYSPGVDGAAYIEYGKNEESFLRDPMNEHLRASVYLWGTSAVAVPQDAPSLKITQCMYVDFSGNSEAELSAFKCKAMQMKLIQSTLVYLRALKQACCLPSINDVDDKTLTAPVLLGDSVQANPVLVNFVESFNAFQGKSLPSKVCKESPRKLIRIQTAEPTSEAETCKTYLFSTTVACSLTQWVEFLNKNESLYEVDDSVENLKEHKTFSTKEYKTFTLDKQGSKFSFMEAAGLSEMNGEKSYIIGRSNYSFNSTSNQPHGRILVDGVVARESIKDQVHFIVIYHLLSHDYTSEVSEETLVESECKFIRKLCDLC
ncbi:hypothetical protein, conserved [Angomonas deanei]|uniref:START domain containing protein n=1 Tax=Angomonas deanei TaxID=59799 RepID=A0A7G2C586_9TRYP|nr:hypothetical protein, conserved [Angomonas deanei]